MRFPGIGSSRAHRASVGAMASLAACVIVFSIATPVAAANQVDPAFGAGFRAYDVRGTDDTPERAHVRPTGQLVIGGTSLRPNDTFVDPDPAFVQLTGSGAPDNGFGTNGTVVIPLPTFSSFEDFAIDPTNGSIVGLARSNSTDETYLFRLKSDGSPDTSFDGDGILALTPTSSPPLPATNHYFHVAVEPDHKIVMGGVAVTSGPRENIVRLLDANGGFINESGLNIGNDGSAARALAVSPNGSLIAELVDVDDDGTGHDGIGIWMLDGAGIDPVPGFGDSSGRVLLTVPGGARAADIAVSNDGRVTIAGNTLSSPRQAIVAKFRANGTLDPSFDTDGKKLIGIASLSGIQALGVEAAGRLTLIGQAHGGIAVARVKIDGSTATGFAGTGKVSMVLPRGFGSVGGGVGPGGSVLIGGSIAEGTVDYAAVKFTAAGVADSSFHAGGITEYGGSVHPGDVQVAQSVAAAPNGDRFLAGVIRGNQPQRVKLLALLPNGYRDPTFGLDGIGEFALNDTIGRGMAIASGNRPVVVGCANCSQDHRSFLVARWSATGQLDTNFGGGDGIVTTSFGGADANATSAAIASDGKIVVAGIAGSQIAVARYKVGGGLDPTFSGDGKRTISFTGQSVAADAVAIQSDGKIVVAGTLFNQAGESYAVARLNSDGSLDTGFGTGGRVVTAFTAGPSEASSMAIRSDGRIIVAGSVTTTNGSRVGVTRYLTNGTLDPALDGDGRLLSGLGLAAGAGASAVAADGSKIVVAGTVFGNDPVWFVGRFNGNGTVDMSFNGTGHATVPVGTDGEADALTITPENNYLVVGQNDNPLGESEMAAVQFLH
jgi:uncharacterized delta-60 repeat protein